MTLVSVLLVGIAVGIAGNTLAFGFCWAFDRHRRGLSIYRKWR